MFQYLCWTDLCNKAWYNTCAGQFFYTIIPDLIIVPARSAWYDGSQKSNYFATSWTLKICVVWGSVLDLSLLSMLYIGILCWCMIYMQPTYYECALNNPLQLPSANSCNAAKNRCYNEVNNFFHNAANYISYNAVSNNSYKTVKNN
jgi:hypothetical protein